MTDAVQQLYESSELVDVIDAADGESVARQVFC